MNIRRRTVPLVTLAALLASAWAVSTASAASHITACFSYGGYAYRNLSTSAWSLRTNGGYGMIPGSFYMTDNNGCVRYTITGSDRHDSRIKIRASASAPAWRGYLDGFSYQYAPDGGLNYTLARTGLHFYALPSTVPDPPVQNGNPGGLTASWMDALNNNPGSTGCNTSTAMQVACYMDANHLHGNVVVVSKDSDGDHCYDWQDNYVFDKFRC
jgi:hypothetical protein